MRLVIEVAMVAVVVAVFLTIARGFAPVTNMGRFLLTPIGIGALTAGFFLLRYRRTGRSTSR